LHQAGLLLALILLLVRQIDVGNATELKICVNYVLFENTMKVDSTAGGVNSKETLRRDFVRQVAGALLAVEHINTRNCTILRDTTCTKMLSAGGGGT
jgi:hypothetical protein